MTMWILPRSTECIERVVADGELELGVGAGVESDDTILIYRPNEADLIGRFRVIDAGPQGTATDDESRLVQVLVEEESLYRVSVDREADRKRYADGLVELDRSQTEVKQFEFDRSDEIFDITDDAVDSEEAADDGSQAVEDLSALVKATERLPAKDRDFSGETHGRLVLNEQVLRGSNLSYTVLDGSEFIDAELQDVDFRGASLVDVDFSGASLAGADFRGANLSQASFDQDLTRCRFEGASMTDADLTGATLEGADLSETVLDDANLRGTRPRKACFDGASLKDIKCQGAEFNDASFQDANLSGSTLAAADFTGADFSGARLTKTNFTRPTIDEVSYQSADLRNASFEEVTAEGIDFSAANLTDAVFTQAELDGARFAGARLPGADFRQADISGAVMTDAKASDADFRHSVIERVAFGQTELFGAQFGGAAFYGAILNSARIGGDTTFHLERETAESLSTDDAGESDPNRKLVVYDPDSTVGVPDGVSGEPGHLEKAQSVYQTLEAVMEENAYGEQASGYFWSQKEMQRRQARQQGSVLGVPSSVMWWQNSIQRYSCGYGESFRYLFTWALLVTVFTGGIYPFLGLSHATLGKLTFDSIGVPSFYYGLQFSLSAFTGLGYGQFDVGSVGEVIVTFETGLGVLFFALFIFVLTRNVTR